VQRTHRHLLTDEARHVVGALSSPALLTEADSPRRLEQIVAGRQDLGV